MIHTKTYTVITADIVNSRQTADAVLKTIPNILEKLNQTLKPVLPAALFAGDEIQILFDNPPHPFILVLQLQMLFQPMTLKVGMAQGPIHLPLLSEISETRGPAFIAARQALEIAKQRDCIAWMNRVTDENNSFGVQPTNQLNALFLTLTALTNRWSAKTWRRFTYYAQERSIQKVAGYENVSPEAINKFIRTAGVRYLLTAMDIFATHDNPTKMVE